MHHPFQAPSQYRLGVVASLLCSITNQTSMKERLVDERGRSTDGNFSLACVREAPKIHWTSSFFLIAWLIFQASSPLASIPQFKKKKVYLQFKPNLPYLIEIQITLFPLSEYKLSTITVTEPLTVMVFQLCLRKQLCFRAVAPHLCFSFGHCYRC